jgi:sentrin-specific protease 1
MKLLQTNERNLKRNNMLSLGHRSSVGGSSVSTKRSTGLGLLPDDDINSNNSMLSPSSKENRIVSRVRGSSGVKYSSPSSSTARLSYAASHISSSLRTRRHSEQQQQQNQQYHLQPTRIYIDTQTIHAIRAEVDALPLPATLSSICLALQSSHTVLETYVDADLYSRRQENDVDSMKRLEILGSFMSELNFESPIEKSQRRRDEFKTACMSLATRGNTTMMTTWDEVQIGLSDIFLFAKFDVNSTTTGEIIGSGGSILSTTPSHSFLRGSSNSSWKDKLSAITTKPSVKRAHRLSHKMARPEPSPNKRTTTRPPNPITPAVGNFLSIDSFRDQIMNRMGRAKFLRIFQQGEVRSIPYLDETTARLDDEIARRVRERPSTVRADAIIAAKEKADRERQARESAMKLMRPLTDEESDIVLEATEGIGPVTQIVASQDADSVQRGSMQTLRPGQWLNDEVINYFLKNCLAKRDEIICARQVGRKRSHFFNSFFVQTMFDEKNNNPNLRGKYNYKNVKRWSKKVPGKDIFNLKYILCPINLDNMHWTSAVIYMEEKRIQYYDSMGGTDRTKLKGLLEYVKDEYKAKNGGQEMDVSEWELVSCTSDTPRQRNGFDCGVFTCMFCDFISKDCALVFNQSHIDQCRDRIALSIMKNCAIE